MRMRLWFGIAMVTGPALLDGCGKRVETIAPATRVAAPVTMELWQKRCQELTAAVKPGMTEEEVTRAAGEPKWVTASHSGGPTAIWKYDLGENHGFFVRFDNSNRVAKVGLEIAVQVQ